MQNQKVDTNIKPLIVEGANSESSVIWLDRAQIRHRRLEKRTVRRFWRTILKTLDTRFPIPATAMLSREQKAEIANILKPGDLLLETNSCYPGWQLAARFAMASIWMHAAIYVGEGLIIDAGTEPTVSIVPLDQFLKTTDIAIYRPKYTCPADADAVLQFARQNLGKRFNITFDPHGENSFYCTQLISSALHDMPNPIFLRWSRMLCMPWKRVISPSAIANNPDIQCLWTSQPSLAKDLRVQWPVLVGAIAGALFGLFSSIQLSVVGAGLGAMLVIIAGNVLHEPWCP